METKFTKKDVKKPFKLDLISAGYGDGDVYMLGTAYTGNRIIENVICIVNYDQIKEQSKKHCWKWRHNEYLSTIKVD